MKRFMDAECSSAVYNLCDGSELEVFCVELVGEEVNYVINAARVKQAFTSYTKIHFLEEDRSTEAILD